MPNNHAVFDQERFPACHSETLLDAKSFEYHTFGVGDQGERKLMFVLERFLSLLVVGADTEHG